MMRYLRALRLFWHASVAAEMEYRLNFVLAVTTSLGNLVGNLFALSLFYRNGATLGGWSWEEALVVAGLATTMEGFGTTFLRPNVGQLVQHVREGTLDFVLLKPIDSQFWLSTRSPSIWGVPNLVYGLLLVVYAGHRMELGFADYLRGLPSLAAGFVILYALWFALSATSIWFVRVHSLNAILHSLTSAGRYPVSAYPAIYRFVFTFIVPVALMTTLPAGTVLGRSPLRLGLWSWAGALLLFAACRVWWRRALRSYTSASS